MRVEFHSSSMFFAPSWITFPEYQKVCDQKYVEDFGSMVSDIGSGISIAASGTFN